MGAYKDRLIQAAELLDMSPDDLMTLLESTYRYPFADGLLGIARERQAVILSGSRVDPEDARTLARAFRELDIHLSAGGTPPEEWREGPDAPGADDGPRGISFSREQVEAWAGYPMTDEQVADLEDVLPNSTFPETVGLVAEAWRPDDEQPDREPTPAQEEAWDVREDEARGHVLG